MNSFGKQMASIQIPIPLKRSHKEKKNPLITKTKGFQEIYFKPLFLLR